PPTPMAQSTVDGYPRALWWNADGETLVESYTITDMAHGTPLGTADNDEQYGAQGAFLIEAGISSSYHIANFFGLTEWIRPPKEVAKEATKEAAKEVAQKAAKPAGASKEPVKKIPVTSPLPAGLPDLAAVLWPRATLHREPPHPSQ